jgi:hypothetical protein
MEKGLWSILAIDSNDEAIVAIRTNFFVKLQCAQRRMTTKQRMRFGLKRFEIL